MLAVLDSILTGPANKKPARKSGRVKRRRESIRMKLQAHLGIGNAQRTQLQIDACAGHGIGTRVVVVERDPAYARPDGYHGRFGPSWLHRWAMAEHKPKTFYAGEPEVPKWVLDLAGVDGE